MLVCLEREREALLGLVGGLDDATGGWSPEDGIPTIAEHLKALLEHEIRVAGRLAGGNAVSKPPAGRRLRGGLQGLVSQLASQRSVTLGVVAAGLRRGGNGGAAAEGESVRPGDVFACLLSEEVYRRAHIESLQRLMNPGLIPADSHPCGIISRSERP